jgi:hypothetical protein
MLDQYLKTGHDQAFSIFFLIYYFVHLSVLSYELEDELLNKLRNNKSPSTCHIAREFVSSGTAMKNVQLQVTG